MGPGPDEHTILVVDDEPEVADMVALQLRREYDVRTAYGGEEALAAVDEDVDLVLLDRRMPGVPGDEVLAAIRDRGLDCRVVMMTAVAPDYDVLGMEFNDYLCKPVPPETLLAVVDVQFRIPREDPAAEFFDLAAKRALLEQNKPRFELDDHDGYRRLTARLEELRERLGDRLAEFGDLPDAVLDLDRT